jgi:uncharacterized protein (DUF58 family)
LSNVTSHLTSSGRIGRRTASILGRLIERPGENVTPVRRKPSFDFSLTGLIYCSMMMFMGLAAINQQANLLFGVFGLMIGVLLISGVICRLVLSRLRVRRTLPEYCIIGQSTTLYYHFKNHKIFWPSLSVTMAELEGNEAFEAQPAAYMLHAAAGMEATVPVEVTPKRRGQHRLGIYQIGTSFPFGFIKRAVERKEPDTLLVCPALGKVSPALLSLCRSAEKMGAAVKPRRGGEDEFYGVKEYRAGDNPKRIYWRRSARTPGVMVSKEMTQVAPPRLMLLVDTLVRADVASDRADVERCLAMAASLASFALDDGLAVGVCGWEGQDWAMIPPQGGKRQRRDVLALLARLPTNRTAESGGLLKITRGMMQSGTTAVLFTPRDVQLGLTDQVRGALMVIPSGSRSAQSWFSFDPAIDFARCVPMDDPSKK